MYVCVYVCVCVLAAIIILVASNFLLYGCQFSFFLITADVPGLLIKRAGVLVLYS